MEDQLEIAGTKPAATFAAGMAFQGSFTGILRLRVRVKDSSFEGV